MTQPVERLGSAALIAAAVDVIGEGAPDDHRIQPARHATALGDRAPALAAVLRRAAVATCAAEFERLDARAVEAQAVFKRIAGRANLAVFATASLSALLLLAGLLDVIPDLSRQVALGVLGAAGIAAGGLSAMWIFRLKQGHLLDRWMRARAGAESRRVQYFERVTTGETAPVAVSDVPLPLLQLEYFRRYHLDVQLAYYRTRGRRHRDAADQTVRLEAVAVLLASVAAGAGGVLAAATGEVTFAAIAALGVIGAALAAFAAAREGINGDGRNAERYERTYESLVGLRESLDDVREAASRGEREPLDAFVAAVNEEVSVEHRQWLDATEGARAGVERIEAALAAARVRTP